MKTIFLAAGRSSRMDPIEDKNFLDFGGEALILKLLKNAQNGGAKNFIIVGNLDNRQKIEALCASHDFLKNTSVTIQENLDEGMAGGILAGLEFVDDDESVLVHNGNDFVQSSAIASTIESGKVCDGALLGQKRTVYFPGGYLEKNEDGKILSIVEKPGEGNEPSDLVNIVVHSFSKALDLKLALNKAHSKNDDVYEVALDSLFKSKNFKAVEYDQDWQTIKYPWHVLEMMDIFLATQKSHIDASADIAKSAIIKGNNVLIESGVKIYENAVICGPCYIGKNVIVGNNALVRSSNIGEGSTVGYNTEVARSWIGRNVTSHIAYIGDSVVEANANFGAYSCTANLRLDKKTVRVNIKEEKIDSRHQKLGSIVGKGTQIGIGAKLMPGSKIPVETFIRPGEIWT